MRKLLVLVVLVTVTHTHAQRKDAEDIFDRGGVIERSFRNLQYQGNINLPYRSIRILDLRFDNSTIGYVRNGDGSKFFRKIVIAEDWNELFNNYFKSHLNPEAKEELLICIKSFWIQEGYDGDNQHFDRTLSLFNSEDGSATIINLDIYLKTDSLCQAILRMDTVYSFYNKLLLTNIHRFLSCPLDSMASHLNKIDVSMISEKKRKIPYREVEEYYLNRFRLPVLHDSLKKGIFLSYDHFRNNSPLVTEFKFDKNKHTDELYTIANGEQELIKDYWGFFDGEKLYIKLGFSAYPATRRLNSFYIFGAKSLKNKLGSDRPGDLLRYDKMTRYERLLQLNMDVGEFY